MRHRAQCSIAALIYGHHCHHAVYGLGSYGELPYARSKAHCGEVRGKVGHVESLRGHQRGAGCRQQRDDICATESLTAFSRKRVSTQRQLNGHLITFG